MAKHSALKRSMERKLSELSVGVLPTQLTSLAIQLRLFLVGSQVAIFQLAYS